MTFNMVSEQSSAALAAAARVESIMNSVENGIVCIMATFMHLKQALD